MHACRGGSGLAHTCMHACEGANACTFPLGPRPPPQDLRMHARMHDMEVWPLHACTIWRSGPCMHARYEGLAPVCMHDMEVWPLHACTI